MTPRACILGCSGLALDAEERAFFRDADPWGFIVFRRNVENPEQLRALTSDLRDAVGRDALVFVDQEGGRVQRLTEPHWRKRRPAADFGAIHRRDPQRARDAVKLNHHLMALELREVGLDADCAPVLEVCDAAGDPIIGDRAFSPSPDVVGELGRAALAGLAAGGVVAVIKHMPGHGRADADSHESLPRITASCRTLETTDFSPFKALANAPAAMTAHVVYDAIDPAAPATTSLNVVQDVIRGRIGFDGLLMTDDLSMKALQGSFEDRARDAIAAGCDMLLHCNGVRAEMDGVVAGAPRLDGDALRRADRALGFRTTPEPLDKETAEARLAALFADAAA